MTLRQVLQWCLPGACLVATCLMATTAEAAPLVAQPNLAQSVAPATVGFYRHGWGGYRGWGAYYYGRPSIYYSYRYRPYRSVVRYSYRPSYNYAYVSPYYSSGFAVSTCCGVTPVSYYGYRPVVYTQPVYQTPVYTSFYSGYSYPTYSFASYRGRGYGFGYPAITPYYSTGYYGGYW